jgi:hypothetical protein
VRDIAEIVDVSHQHVSRIVRDRNALPVVRGEISTLRRLRSQQLNLAVAGATGAA